MSDWRKGLKEDINANIQKKEEDKKIEESWSYLGSNLPSAGWEQLEGELASHLKNLDAGRWEREDNQWFLKDKDRKDIQRDTVDSCMFLKDETSCKNFLKCIEPGGDKRTCLRIPTVDDIKSVNDVTKEFAKVHPMAAVTYLKNLGF